VEFKFVDDARDPTKAISAFTELAGQGVQVFGGTVDSGIAVQLGELAAQNQVLLIGGNSVGDGLTGLNEHTFRSSRQIAQEAATIKGLIESPGANVTVLAQDYATGQGYVKAIKETLTDANVSEVLVPLTATEFTPYAQQVASAKPDLLVVIFYGETTAALWQALEQQGVTASTQVIAPLVEPQSYGQYGPSVGNIKFFAQYCPLCSDTEENKFLLDAVPDASLSTADGFTNALMIVRALQESPDDVQGMIKALEGYEFTTAKGEVAVRESDHALEQPMFIVSLVPGDNGELQPELVQTVDAETVSPPEK
jgi:branched-chain amino acid transport system substrate-binding protein